MIAENPAPDNDTMETLINTNEQLAKAMSQHQRSILNARKVMGLGSGQTPPPGPPPGRTESSFAPPPGPPPNSSNPPIPAQKPAPQIPPPGDFAPNLADDDEEARNPFADPEKGTAKAGKKAVHGPPTDADHSSTTPGQFNESLGIGAYHPGFRETPSYMGRQNSSVGHTTMHAAGAIDEDYEKQVVDPPETGYGAQTGAKAPIYRY
jgi:hypothetical protein